MADFITIDMSRAVVVDAYFSRVVTELPSIAISLPRNAASAAVGAIVAAVKDATPVDTGALKEQTDGRVVDVQPLEAKLQVFSTAENARSGYQYAQARAFGFYTVQGNLWTPPEQPPYPEAAAQQAGAILDQIQPETLGWLRMRLSVIPH